MVRIAKYLAAAVLLAFSTAHAFAQANQIPPGEVCFQATVGINGQVAVLGTITGGSGGTAGTYTNVTLTGGSGTTATANITVAGGTVTAVVILNPGINYVVADVLSAASGTIGGVSGFSVPVLATTVNSAIAGGSVGMYIPSTLTPSQTWQNPTQTILNTNPIGLDSNGCATIWGVGQYRQIVYDSLGNVIWDKLVQVAGGNPFYAGAATGSANTITVTDAGFSSANGTAIFFVGAAANTGAATINVGTGALSVWKSGPSGPTALTGGEIQPNTEYMIVYQASVSGGGPGWFIYSPIPNLPYLGINAANVTPLGVAAGTSGGFALFSGGGTNTIPGGRLTLASHTPVMTTPQLAKATIFYDSYVANGYPYFNGTADQTATITANELSDTIPASGTGTANAAGVFDEWAIVGSVICHATNGSGGGWASDTGGSNTARGTGYSQLDFSTRSYVTNKNALSNCYNGSTSFAVPANQATYLGTCATDPAAATFTFNAFPAGASGGPVGGAVINCWNYYNRVNVKAIVLDNSGSAFVPSASATWVAHDNGTTKNIITVVSGVNEDTVEANYMGFTSTSNGNSGSAAFIGVSIDAATPVCVAGTPWDNASSTGTVQGSAIAHCPSAPIIGKHTYAAQDYPVIGTNSNFYSFGNSSGAFGQMFTLDFSSRY